MSDNSLENLKAVSSAVSRDDLSKFEEVINKVFDEVLVDYKEHFNTFLVAYCRRLAGRVIKYMDTIESIEDEIMRPVRVQQASTKELIQYLKIIQSQLNTAVGLLQTMTQNPSLKIKLEDRRVFNLTNNNLNTSDGSAVDLSDKNSRAHIRSFFTGLLNKLPSVEAELVENASIESITGGSAATDSKTGK